MDITGFITAGGRSSRMGRDKAWLDLDGRAMIERIIDALTPAVSSVAIIANSPAHARLGLPVFADTTTGIGPLEAIRTALINCSTSHALLVGCDMPFVTTELFVFLASIAGEFEAVVPTGSDGRLEPLCAVYSRRALKAVAELIESGERKVSPLFDLIQTRFVAFDELRHIDSAELLFLNVNTPEDYHRAVRITQDQARNYRSG